MTGGKYREVYWRGKITVQGRHGGSWYMDVTVFNCTHKNILYRI
jgi:predicted secreted hydrolase